MEARELFENESIELQSNKEEKKYLGLLLLILAFTSCMFLASTIIASQMNYDSRRANILSYYTVQSNIIVTVWLFFISLYILTGRKMYKLSMDINFSAAITTYIQTTGIIFWLVLVPIFYSAGETWMFSITNIWLHTFTPILSVILFNYVKSNQSNIETKSKLLLFYIYPIFYITLAIMYALNDVFLYPMFSPALVGGWAGVAMCIIVMCTIFTGLYLALLYGIKIKKKQGEDYDYNQN